MRCSAPFLVGIDLGTTNSACAFVDTRGSAPRSQLFGVPQLVAPGDVEPRPALPSFLYFPARTTSPRGAVAAVGRQAPTPSSASWRASRARWCRRGWSSSAKSWLAHRASIGTAAILPWGGDDAGPRMSPVDASARYLAHIRDAWDAHGRIGRRRRCARAPDDRAHGAGVVRRGGARADRRGRAERREFVAV